MLHGSNGAVCGPKSAFWWSDCLKILFRRLIFPKPPNFRRPIWEKSSEIGKVEIRKFQRPIIQNQETNSGVISDLKCYPAANVNTPLLSTILKKRLQLQNSCTQTANACGTQTGNHGRSIECMMTSFSVSHTPQRPKSKFPPL